MLRAFENGLRGKQDTAQLRNFKPTHFFMKGKIEILKSRTFPCVNESAVRRNWRKNTAGQ